MPHAQAQSSLGIGTNEATLPSTGVFAHWFNLINFYQQQFYRSLTGALKAMRTDGSKLWLLAGLSFAYGIFHAAGPGHGKAVISSYMLANEVALRRGILLSFISAFLQALTAIVLMTLVFLVLRGTSISMTDATWFLEVASYALITAFGAWLLWKKVAPLFRGRPAHSLSAAAPAHPHGHAHHDHHHDHGAHDHEHDHDVDDDSDHDMHDHAHRHSAETQAARAAAVHRHGVHDHSHADHDHSAHTHAANSSTSILTGLSQAFRGHSHDHDHVHGDGEVCETCGHSHAPDPALLSGDRFDWRTAWSALVAVGLRPCSGALIVLSFAFLNGLWAGGILSVMAMAVGTGITVAILATIAVTAKNWAVMLAGNGRIGSHIHTAIEILGAAFVLVVGLLLLTASLTV
ncbi:nickel/cobalt transporter [Mesorhizobium sp. BAC0120]|nr:nickel/cobalt transporter [Mesorhizobium sp. BAC0120]MDW6024466.1 nickel/cobalt transporter [Mesorhizobium sp. BAC0120]